MQVSSINSLLIYDVLTVYFGVCGEVSGGRIRYRRVWMVQYVMMTLLGTMNFAWNFSFTFFINWVFDKQMTQSFLSLMVLILSGYDKSLILGQSETLWSLLLQNQHFKLNCYLSVLLLFPDIWNMLLLLIILIVLTFVTRILFCVFTCFNNWSNWKEVRQRG